MIDASKGFMKDGAKNRLRSRDMRKIIDTYLGGIEEERYSRMVPTSEISAPKNDYNLNISRYIDSSEPEDIQDLGGHLNGGIPERDIDALEDYWQAFPHLREYLFNPLREGYVELTVEPSQVAETIEQSSDVKEFSALNTGQVEDWWDSHKQALESINSETKPNDLIQMLGDDLLEKFKGRPLISEYAVYEQLMSYWHETMHDDVALLIHSGWQEAAQPREARITGYDNKKKPKYEEADIKFGTGAKTQRWVTDLIPPQLIIDRYLLAERDRLEHLILQQEQAAQELAEFLEENSAEEGLLYEAVNEEGGIKKKDITDRLKSAKAENADQEEIDALNHANKLFAVDTKVKKLVKEMKTQLDIAALRKYPELTADEVRQLVVMDKWSCKVRNLISQLDLTITQNIKERVEIIGSRYEFTLADFNDAVRLAQNQLKKALEGMGL